VGIHRDDIAFFINGKSAYAYASQGQMRTIALALKLASAEILKLETSEIPVILLDDVFSELDNTRKEYLTKALPGFQKIITSADEMGGIFIKNGQVVPRGTK
jgi:DNA replication and repair protein RecF